MGNRLTLSEVNQHNAKVFNARMKEDKPESPWIGKESELHSQIEAELKRRRYYYIHSRTDKRATNNIGCPDFVICAPNGVTLFCEIKRKGGKLSPEQTIMRHVLLALGHKYETIFSMSQFLQFINNETITPETRK